MLRMLAHQLRSPAWQCYTRAHELVRQLDPDERLSSGESATPELRRAAAIRGLARKTRSVAWSIDMMSKLTHSDRVELSRIEIKSLSPRTLLKMARETAQDIQLVRRLAANSKQRLKGSPHQPSVPEIRITIDEHEESHLQIMGEAQLIEQCVSCVLDNSFKYSKPTSAILIECLFERESFTLSVLNKPIRGLEIDHNTQTHCRIKDWRSDVAKASDADGTGLGLWLVDRIMTAHCGALEVHLTDAKGWNKFSLRFPLKSASEPKKST
jgi:K+-sensing histidine kinase KdpD